MSQRRSQVIRGWQGRIKNALQPKMKYELEWEREGLTSDQESLSWYYVSPQPLGAKSSDFENMNGFMEQPPYVEHYARHVCFVALTLAAEYDAWITMNATSYFFTRKNRPHVDQNIARLAPEKLASIIYRVAAGMPSEVQIFFPTENVSMNISGYLQVSLSGHPKGAFLKDLRLLLERNGLFLRYVWNDAERGYLYEMSGETTLIWPDGSEEPEQPDELDDPDAPQDSQENSGWARRLATGLRYAVSDLQFTVCHDWPSRIQSALEPKIHFDAEPRPSLDPRDFDRWYKVVDHPQVAEPSDEPLRGWAADGASAQSFARRVTFVALTLAADYWGWITVDQPAAFFRMRNRPNPEQNIAQLRPRKLATVIDRAITEKSSGVQIYFPSENVYLLIRGDQVSFAGELKGQFLKDAQLLMERNGLYLERQDDGGRRGCRFETSGDASPLSNDEAERAGSERKSDAASESKPNSENVEKMNKNETVTPAGAGENGGEFVEPTSAFLLDIVPFQSEKARFQEWDRYLESSGYLRGYAHRMVFIALSLVYTFGAEFHLSNPGAFFDEQAPAPAEFTDELDAWQLASIIDDVIVQNESDLTITFPSEDARIVFKGGFRIRIFAAEGELTDLVRRLAERHGLFLKYVENAGTEDEKVYLYETSGEKTLLEVRKDTFRLP